MNLYYLSYKHNIQKQQNMRNLLWVTVVIIVTLAAIYELVLPSSGTHPGWAFQSCTLLTLSWSLCNEFFLFVCGTFHDWFNMWICTYMCSKCMYVSYLILLYWPYPTALSFITIVDLLVHQFYKHHNHSIFWTGGWKIGWDSWGKHI